ncbi:SigE family RNA polymerase sigma factor [Nocardioides mangrovi]|uniref:SigE family RNA polymerase sigma factor n=1 Tax=Nocardioides mangrovi TaxID=2874580 RepID=A0ABS7UHL4_9ACTN|nr:SigE family RNA polymerase sigma factor [Nocardioides mangrovi]MBZ5740128.1 SigE family RNA polymerase sigma factor [Nocardioides mangrovi]
MQTDDFAEFYRSTWPRLYRTAYAVAGDAAAAEDALQTAFARAYASWRRVRAAEHPEAYVRRIVVNEVISAARRPWRRERASESPPDRGMPDATAAVADRDELWRAVLALPVRQRAVVVLRYYEDLSEEQIAEVLGCSRGTVKSQASDALAALRRHAGVTIGDLS